MSKHPQLIPHRKISEHWRFAPLRHRRLLGVLDALCGDRENAGQRPPGVRPAVKRSREARTQASRGGGAQGLDDAVEIIGERRGDGGHGPHVIAPPGGPGEGPKTCRAMDLSGRKNDR